MTTEQDKRAAALAALGMDAAGRSVVELLREGWRAAYGAGGGPLVECFFLKAQELEDTLPTIREALAAPDARVAELEEALTRIRETAKDWSTSALLEADRIAWAALTPGEPKEGE